MWPARPCARQSEGKRTNRLVRPALSPQEGSRPRTAAVALDNDRFFHPFYIARRRVTAPVRCAVAATSVGPHQLRSRPLQFRPGLDDGAESRTLWVEVNAENRQHHTQRRQELSTKMMIHLGHPRERWRRSDGRTAAEPKRFLGDGKANMPSRCRSLREYFSDCPRNCTCMVACDAWV